MTCSVSTSGHAVTGFHPCVKQSCGWMAVGYRGILDLPRSPVCPSVVGPYNSNYFRYFHYYHFAPPTHPPLASQENNKCKGEGTCQLLEIIPLCNYQPLFGQLGIISAEPPFGGCCSRLCPYYRGKSQGCARLRSPFCPYYKTREFTTRRALWLYIQATIFNARRH